ncbi:hypothetical protein QOZ80_2AG0116100 [Eleusine coracana subsp. coracana]|nr:hypothetical protein QOZ80_2AG0116100 [Eleusine coracana subsp. coracana]
MDNGSYFPTDAFVEILLRIPPSSWRRLRLVCRHWREVIDERAPEKRSRPKALTFVARNKSASAFVIEDIPDGPWPCRVVWTDGVTPGTDHRPAFRTEMLGTCNGLLCLYTTTGGGAISLVNPITGEMPLALPPLPRSGRIVSRNYERHEAYSFGFLPTTGQYKMVRFPCYLDNTHQFIDVQVLTVGEASWHNVPAPPRSTCCLASGIMILDGTVHWVTKDTGRLASLDLSDERFTPTMSLPVPFGPGFLTRLTEVCGRLGIIASVDHWTPAKTEVWVLGDGQRATKGCRVQVHGVKRRLPRPHFAHGGCVLTYDQSVLFGHMLSGEGRLQCHDVRISTRKPKTQQVASVKGYICAIFAYVETKEALSVYRIGHLNNWAHSLYSSPAL